MYDTLKPVLEQELAQIENAGLYKRERIITSPQGADITVQGGKHVINFCANNYLGLSAHPKIISAAKEATDTHGYGLSSVRFICGTQDIHKTLEKRSPNFWAPKIPFFTQRHSTPTAGCLSRCLTSRTPLYRMN